jgi:hypothetical protein
MDWHGERLVGVQSSRPLLGLHGSAARGAPEVYGYVRSRDGLTGGVAPAGPRAIYAGAMVSPGSPIHSYEHEKSSEDDWPAQMAESIDRIVGTVRDKTTGPALTVARGVVYGTFGAVVAVAALVLFVIAAVRVLDAYLPDSLFGETHTWAAHLLLGLVFTVAGILLWLRRRPRAVEQTSHS